MDIKTLYSMVRSSSDSARKTLDSGIESPNHYVGYPIYIEQYNKFQKISIDLFGGEISDLFPPIRMLYWIDPQKEQSRYWLSHFEEAAERLASLATYLQSKLGDKEQRIQEIIDLIEANLRPSVFEDPENEREVQNVLEIIFRARSMSFLREKIRIPYSSKTYIPDFSFDSLNLAVEVKICNKNGREKGIIDEINADILAYQTKYKNQLFIVYDLGFIRDVSQFRSDIEKNINVHAIVIKK